MGPESEIAEDDGVEENDEAEEEPSYDFAEDLFGTSRPTRLRLTRAQKREASRRRVHPAIPNELPRKQQEDEEIQHWRAGEDPSRVTVKDGVLFCVWRPWNSEQTYEQIVLPTSYRDRVLKLAHSVLTAGHLGREKTAQRILRRFFWPTLFKDVKTHCQQCPECQLASCQGRNRAPLMPLPIIEEPFSRIAMDIVGPLPKTKQGHRYILVVCDYATRYLEAIALKKFTAPAVAEELIELFSRHGVPREILTDQGTNFTSQLLQELYKMIGVTPIKTTPYHPQTDGLVERFNQTLKQMLRQLIEGEGREWNKLLPYVLFAYREVPQFSSPFELLYGRDVRGPLDILKEGWTRTTPQVDDIVSYVDRVHEQLEAAKDLVQETCGKLRRSRRPGMTNVRGSCNYRKESRY